MIFKVEHYTDEGVHDESGAEHVAPADFWNWRLELADGSIVCAGARCFDTEAAARSDIAQAKKTMKGAFRSKVVTVDADSP